MKLEKITDSAEHKYLKTGLDTCYTADTKPAMIELLESLIATQTRCRFHWGEVSGDKAGLDWGDCHDVEGRIGRSTGNIKIPLLIYNRRSSGGGALLTANIVKITATQGGRVIYEHPNYRQKNTQNPKTIKKSKPIQKIKYELRYCLPDNLSMLFANYTDKKECIEQAKFLAKAENRIYYVKEIKSKIIFRTDKS